LASDDTQGRVGIGALAGGANKGIQPPRVNILGVGVSAIDMREAIELSDQLIGQNGHGYVCVTGVHGISEAQSDSEFRAILNSSFLTTPDGMPTVWVGRMQGYRTMQRVYGPDYMMDLCSLSVSRGYKHFLYGGKPGIAERLSAALTTRFPEIQIVGTYTPPFRPLTQNEELDLIERLNQLHPQILWVGLSTPKQERFMAQYMDRLPVNLMAGVGAAFDIHTGELKDAPAWLKKAGLQWLHRLAQDPRRLWRRYCINNPRFIWRIGLQCLGIRRYSIDG
jgi:N-acetylglucosaminyldiphosphoundecaprenol N-acetyl-beta-D-mannosaminyltransferase